MSIENETQTGAPRTAGALIQEAARVVNWRPDEKYSLQARYDAARAMASMYAYWTIVSLETLRRVNPDLAEAVTTHIDDDLDWPNAHEHAYGWEQTLDAGKPIPAEAWPFWEIAGQPETTQPAGEHHTPIDDWPEIEGTFDEVLERAAQARLGDGEHHTGTLNLAGEGNAPQDTLAALDDEIARTYGGIWAPDNLAEILAKHGWAKASETREQVAEEIAAKGNEIAEEYQATAITHRDLSDEHGRTLKGTSHMTTAHAYRNKADGAWAVAHAAREIGGAE